MIGARRPINHPVCFEQAPNIPLRRHRDFHNPLRCQRLGQPLKILPWESQVLKNLLGMNNVKLHICECIIVDNRDAYAIGIGNLFRGNFSRKDSGPHRYGDASPTAVSKAKIEKPGLRRMFPKNPKQHIQFAGDLLEIIDSQTR